MSKTADRLKVTKPSDREIVLERVFDAPRSRVFAAMTTPESLKRWFGPHGWSLVSCAVDLRVGGAWRYVLRGPDGSDFGMRGVYREIAPPERVVFTEGYDLGDWPDLLVTGQFTEEGGKTRLKCTVLHPSKEICAANAQMPDGAAETYDRLAEYLASLA